MSLQAPARAVMPEQTLPVAGAACPPGPPAMRMRDALGPIETNATLAARFAHTGRPAEAPAQRALLTVMPCAAGLSAAQAAEAVRARLDWPYALALELTAPGCDASVLSAFRQRLRTGQAARLLFETMVPRVRAQKCLTAQGRPRTDATPVWAAMPTRNRLACVGATRRQALHVLAPAAPAGLPSWGPAGWGDR